jgi:hypothetical protein
MGKNENNCDLLRDHATMGYGPSNVTPTSPWTSSDDRRTQSHVFTLCSQPICAPGGAFLSVGVGGWGRRWDLLRDRRTQSHVFTL